MTDFSPKAIKQAYIIRILREHAAAQRQAAQNTDAVELAQEWESDATFADSVADEMERGEL